MKSKKKIAIGLLCMALVFMGLGYSLFSTTLNITGSSQSSGSFDVKITNVEVDESNTSSGATNTMESVGNNYAVTETTLSAEFNAPGDYITYDITVTNRGSIDAVISVETNMLDETDEFELSCEVTEGTEVLANNHITFPCIMKFKDDVDNLSNIETANMSVSLKAVQKATYTPPASPQSILSGKIFKYESLGSSEPGVYAIENIEIMKNVTETTMDIYDFDHDTYMTVPYTYDANNNIINVFNGAYVLNIINLEDNIIVYDESTHSFASTNSNVGTQLMTGYSFYGTIGSLNTPAHFTFDVIEDANGIHGVVKSGSKPERTYYLIDNTNSNNGEAQLFVNGIPHTVTKTNGVYTSITYGNDTYQLTAPTP